MRDRILVNGEQAGRGPASAVPRLPPVRRLGNRPSGRFCGGDLDSLEARMKRAFRRVSRSRGALRAAVEASSSWNDRFHVSLVIATPEAERGKQPVDRFATHWIASRFASQCGHTSGERSRTRRRSFSMADYLATGTGVRTADFARAATAAIAGPSTAGPRHGLGLAARRAEPDVGSGRGRSERRGRSVSSCHMLWSSTSPGLGFRRRAYRTKLGAGWARTTGAG